MTFVAILLTLLVLTAAITLVWRWAGWPCPAWLVPLLENPYFDAVAGAKTILERAGIQSGMRVLDAGCGPGRLTLAAAGRVGPSGHVLALDIQPAMLEKLKLRLARHGLTNVDLMLAGLGEGKLPQDEFDVVLLVTVLGEIADKLAALRELHRSLRPGGVLSVTEVLPDPHYQTVGRVRRLAAEVGFHEGQIVRGCLSFTINLTKRAAV